MWVHGDHLGTAVAADPVEAICSWTRLQGAKRVILWVADGNSRARRFYERVGFKSTGQRQSLPSAPEIGEELMQRHVDGGLRRDPVTPRFPLVDAVDGSLTGTGSPA